MYSVHMLASFPGHSWNNADVMCNHAYVTQAYLLSSRGQARCISQNNIFDVFFVSSLLEEWVLQEFRGCWPKEGGREGAKNEGRREEWRRWKRGREGGMWKGGMMGGRNVQCCKSIVN